MTDEDDARLHCLSDTFFDSNGIHAFVIDAATKQVVTATKYSPIGAFGWKLFLKNQLG